MKKPDTPKEGQSIWDVYAVPRAPQVTEAEVLEHMRWKLVEKQAQAELLSIEIRTLKAGIAYLEERLPGAAAPPSHEDKG